MKVLGCLINPMKHLHRPDLLRVLFLLSVLAFIAPWQVANAHPMGNFSINHLSRLEARPNRISVDYGLDLAEIPSLAERNEIDQDDNDEITAAEQSLYKRDKAAVLSRNLKLSVNNRPLRLRVGELRMQWGRGAGGLSTLRLTLRAVASLPSNARGESRIEYADTNFANRAGWKEVVVVAGQGATLQQSNAPSTDATRGLRVYPSGSTPPQRTTASFRLISSKPTSSTRRSQGDVTVFRLTGSTVGSTQSTLISTEVQPNTSWFRLIGDEDTPRNALPAGEAADSTHASTSEASTSEASTSDGVVPADSDTNTPQDAFTQAIAERKLTPRLMLGGLLLAFVFGASHALSPGHGKTMVAAYLVGERGTWRHAVLLGIVVTVTHTLGVFLLGMGVWFAAATVEPDRLYPILSTASGLMIFSVGLWLLQQRLGGLSKSAHSHGHDHHHGEHTHHDHHHGEHTHHDHHHGEGGHSHVPQGPITLRALIALGISGGLVPCPSALIVLLSSIALHRIGYGLVLISVFSLGLATVLIAIGCVVVSAQGWISRRGGLKLPSAISGLARYLPVASAAAVTLIGIILTWRALGPVTP